MERRQCDASSEGQLPLVPDAASVTTSGMDDETQRRHRIETAIVIARAYERLLEKPAERLELHSDRSGTRFDHGDVIGKALILSGRTGHPPSAHLAPSGFPSKRPGPDHD